MTDNEPLSNEETDDILGFCVALLRAGHSGDIDGMETLINSTPDAINMMPALVGLTVRLGTIAHGHDRFGQLLATWQPGHGIPGVHEGAPAVSPSRTARIARHHAAVGIISAVLGSHDASSAEADQLAAAASTLLPDLYAEGLIGPAVTFARIAEAAVATAALAKGQTVDQAWRELADLMTEQIHRSE